MNITALDGTVALITGASSGIGDATAAAPTTAPLLADIRLHRHPETE